MECAQVNVTGGTGTVSPTTYSIPGIYKVGTLSDYLSPLTNKSQATDPGILINIYTMTSSSTYTIPGPGLFSCDGSSTSPASSTTAKPTSATTLSTSTKSSAAATSSAPSTGNCAALYAQCGGTGWTGATCCISGTCKKSNDYYSQCL